MTRPHRLLAGQHRAALRSLLVAGLIQSAAVAAVPKKPWLGGVRVVFDSAELVTPQSLPGVQLRSKLFQRCALSPTGASVPALVQEWSLRASSPITNRVSVVSRLELDQSAVAHLVLPTLDGRLVQLTQKLGKGRLAFLVSDSQGTDPYGLKEPPVPNALVAHGTYQDTGGSPGAWAGNLLPNYRNVLFSCMWEPIQHPDWNRVNVEQWGQPQALSNGWGDDEGPAEMAVKHPAQLDDILRRFHGDRTPRRRFLKQE